MRPRLLDLFAGEGGAGMGYSRAGFDVFGVDLDVEALARYPFEHTQADALDFLMTRDVASGFDAIHASPPCQRYSTMTADPSRHPDLIAPVRELLKATGLPYVIENVTGARRTLDHPAMLCGSSFGLGVQRHRYFETSFPMLTPPCQHRGVPVGVYGDHPETKAHVRPNGGTSRGVKATSDQHASDSLGGVGWMSWHGMAECIPPSFTEHIGAQLLEHLAAVAA